MRTTLLVTLSLVLMVSDHRLHYLATIRYALSAVVAPVQYLVDAPVELLKHVETSFTSQQELLDANATLRANQLLLQAKVQKLLALEKENAQLRALLSSSARVGGKVLVAQLLAVDLDPFDQQAVLDKGKRAGLYVGQPVLDAYGVMGQVVAVGPLTSRILLLTDTRSAVPIQDNRSGVRAIAVGGGDSGRLRLVHVPDTTDLHVGDSLVTSGLALRFPVGYPVGVVSRVDHTTGERFAKITVVPSAHVNRSRQVLLVWPEEAALSQVVEKQLKGS